MIKKLLQPEFIRFLFTGGLNTAVNYGVYALTLALSNNKWIALAVTYIFGMFFNFKTYAHLAFRDKNNKRIRNFILIYILFFLVNRLALYLMSDLGGLNPYLAQLITLGFIPIALYMTLKRFVFKGVAEKN